MVVLCGCVLFLLPCGERGLCSAQDRRAKRVSSLVVGVLWEPHPSAQGMFNGMRAAASRCRRATSVPFSRSTSGIASIGGKDFFEENTRIVTSPLCPELRVRLIAQDCPLYRATEADLERMGMKLPFWGFFWPGGQALCR